VPPCGWPGCCVARYRRGAARGLPCAVPVPLPVPLPIVGGGGTTQTVTGMATSGASHHQSWKSYALASTERSPIYRRAASFGLWGASDAAQREKRFTRPRSACPPGRFAASSAPGLGIGGVFSSIGRDAVLATGRPRAAQSGSSFSAISARRRAVRERDRTRRSPFWGGKLVTRQTATLAASS